MDGRKSWRGPGGIFPDILYVLIKQVEKIEILESPAKSSTFIWYEGISSKIKYFNSNS